MGARTELIEKVGRERKADFKAHEAALAKKSRKSPKSGEKQKAGSDAESVKRNMGIPTPKTMLKVWQGIRKGTLTLSKGAADRASEECYLSFEAFYKPYIMHQLNKRGFSWPNDDYEHKDASLLRHNDTGISAEEVYAILRERFFEEVLLSYNFDGPRVGEGAFRHYTLKTLNTVLHKELKLVPALDEKGKVVYTDKILLDKNKKPKLDKNGNVMRKPRLVPAYILSRDPTGTESDGKRDDLDKGERFVRGQRRKANAETNSSRVSIDVPKCMVRLARVAYLLTLEDKMKKTREPWRLEMIEALFGQGIFSKGEGVDACKIRERELRDRLISEGVIKGVTNFQNEKCLFLSSWTRKWCELYSQVVKGPYSIVNGKLKATKGRWNWVMIVPKYELLEYVDRQERTVNQRQLKALSKCYEETMWSLMLEAGEKESARRGY